MNGEFPWISSDGANGEITVTDGLSEPFDLRGNQSISFADLPSGATYRVTEEHHPGWALISASNDTGTIIARAPMPVVVYVNGYTTSGSLQAEAEKRLVGGEIGDEQFAFGLYTEDGALLRTAYADTEGHVVFAPIEYDYSANGQTFRYVVKEIPGDNNTIRYDDHEVTIVAHVEDDGEGTLIVTPLYEGSLVFVNEKMHSITITKEVADGDRNEAFAFVLSVANADGTPLQGEFVAQRGSDLLGLISLQEPYNFALKHGEELTVRNLPDGVLYEVVELPNDAYRSESTNTSGVLNDDVTAQFINTWYQTPFALPESGGAGLLWFGIVSVICLCGWFWLNGRRKVRE